jgi:predicted  nucleic acid-binding Zn-ribbon protein
MATNDEFGQRLTAAEMEVRVAKAIAAESHYLAVHADRDVADFHGKLEVQKGLIEALRETQIDHGRKLDRLERTTEEGFKEMRQGFKEVRQEMGQGFKEVRQEMGQGFKEVHTELDKMRQGFKDIHIQLGEMRQGFKDVHTQLHGTQQGFKDIHTQLHEMREGFGVMSTGQTEITALLNRIIEDR